MAQHCTKSFPQQVFLEEENGWWIASIGSDRIKYTSYESFLEDWNLVIKY